MQFSPIYCNQVKLGFWHNSRQYLLLLQLCPSPLPDEVNCHPCIGNLRVHPICTAQMTQHIETVLLQSNRVTWLSATLLKKSYFGFNCLPKPLIPCNGIPVAMNKPVGRIFTNTCSAPDRMVCQQEDIAASYNLSLWLSSSRILLLQEKEMINLVVMHRRMCWYYQVSLDEYQKLNLKWLIFWGKTN